MKKAILSVILVMSVLISFSAANAAIFINEFEPNPTGSTNPDWVELYKDDLTNTAGYVLNIISTSTSTEYNTTLPNFNDYLVITLSKVNLQAIYPSANGLKIIDGSTTLSNTGATINLYSGSTLIDSVTYTSSQEGYSQGLNENIGPLVSFENPTPTNQNPDALPPGKPTITSADVGLSTIKWIWNNPSDADFSHTEVYINGAFRANVSGSAGDASEYTATGLTKNTAYTISIYAVDSNSNKNTSETTDTKTTISQGVQLSSVSVSQEVQSSSTTLTETSPINNVAGADYTQLTYSIDELQWEGKDIITFPSSTVSLSGPFSLSLGESGQITFNVNVPEASDVDVYGYYTGTYRVFNSGSEIATQEFSLRILPEDYNSEFLVNDLDLDEDKLTPGQTTTFDVELKNSLSEDLENVVVNIINNELDIDESYDFQDIGEGDRETESYSIEIPYDIDEGDYTLMILIEAEDEDGDNVINYGLIDLSVEKDNHDLIISELEFSEEEATCGSLLYVSAKVFNIGTRDEDDLVLRLINSEIDYEEQLTLKDLAESDDKSFQFQVALPSSMKSGTYIFNAYLTYDNDDDQDNDDHLRKSAGLIVKCGSTSTTTGDSQEVSLEGEFEKTSAIGRLARFDLTLTNIGDEEAVFRVEIIPQSDWTKEVIIEPASELILSSMESIPLKIYITPKEDFTGEGAALIRIYSNGEVVVSDELIVTIEGNEPTGTVTAREISLFEGLEEGSTVFLIGSVVFAVVLIASMYIFANRKILIKPRSKPKTSIKKSSKNKSKRRR